MKREATPVYSAARISAQVARMGRAISRDLAGRPLDVVAILEDAFVFAADLVRHITCPVVCHFVRAEAHDVQVGGFHRREIFFGAQPNLKGRDVLLVDAVLDSGVTVDFLTKRLLETGPRSLRLAVLLDRPQARRVEVKPDYFGFGVDSKFLVGYGLSGDQGFYRNLPYIASLDGQGSRSSGKRRSGLRRSRRGKRVKG